MATEKQVRNDAGMLVFGMIYGSRGRFVRV